MCERTVTPNLYITVPRTQTPLSLDFSRARDHVAPSENYRAKACTPIGIPYRDPVPPIDIPYRDPLQGSPIGIPCRDPL